MKNIKKYKAPPPPPKKKPNNNKQPMLKTQIDTSILEEIQMDFYGLYNQLNFPLFFSYEQLII